MPKSTEGENPSKISKGEETAKFAQRVRAFSFIVLYSSVGTAAGMIGGLVIAVFADGPRDLPPKAAIAGMVIGAIAATVRSRFKE